MYSPEGGVIDEINDRKDLASLGINEGLIPGEVFLVLDLDDVGQSSTSVFLDKVLELGGVIVVLALKSLLSSRDGVLDCDLGFAGSNLLWGVVSIIDLKTAL
jgi:hypothetical protein